jgi:hypothetical protein
MNDVISYNSKPINTRVWKQRIPFIPQETETMDKDPDKYRFQASVLLNDLNALEEKKADILNRTNQYLEVDFLANDISSEYITFLNNNGFKNISTFQLGFGVQSYFKIDNYEDAIKYLSEAIKTLKKYSFEEITKDEVTEKRITLWKSFRLSTPKIKEKASIYIKQFDRLRIDINFIEKESLIDFSQQILASAKEEGVELEIINDSLYIDNIPDGIRKTKNFLEKISRIDKIRSIVLSEFVSFVENQTTGLEKKISNVKIEEVSDNAPVIATLDSGVEKGFLTEKFLLEGLDYTNKEGGPTKGDPFKDTSDHGTGVACEIVYGKNLVEYFLTGEAESLIPLFKIFPIKVLSGGESSDVNYEKIFSLTGPFAEAVKKYNIKIVNISLGSVRPKEFNNGMLSRTGQILDTFASTFGVIFIVAVGNIKLERLEELTKKYPDLLFYKTPTELKRDEDKLEEEVNISIPADLTSGISVGSCVKQKSKYAVSSFSKSFSLEAAGYMGKPDVLSIGGGDWPIDLKKNPPIFHESLSPAIVVSRDFSRLKCENGTSFSAPRITRALGICQIKYPSMSVESMRGLLLHKLSNFKTTASKLGVTNNNGSAKTLEEIDTSFQNNNCKFHKAFCGQGTLTDISENSLLTDSDDEATILIEGTVKSKQLVTYEVPIIKLLGDKSKNKTNKLRLKLSVSILPTVSEAKNVTLSASNKFHVSAVAHIGATSPTMTKKRGKIDLKNQCISNDSSDIILKWTSDYKSKFNPTFKISEKDFIKDDLIKILGDDDTINISLRGINKNDEEENKRFTIIFSIEDLGATGQIRNQINVKLKI